MIALILWVMVYYCVEAMVYFGVGRTMIYVNRESLLFNGYYNCGCFIFFLSMTWRNH